MSEQSIHELTEVRNAVCGCRGHACSGQSCHEEGGEKRKIITMAAGAVIFGGAIILELLLKAPAYIPLAAFIAAYLILGAEIVFRALKNCLRGKVFDENFLMSAATIASFIIGNYHEAVAVMLFYQIGEFFQELAVEKSRKSITNLMDIRADIAHLKKNGEIIDIAPNEVNPDDIIIVKPGEKIPLDGIVIEGCSLLDTRALTGEAVPRKAAAGDTVLSGCINQDGVLTVKVEKPFGESTVAKIVELIEKAAGRKAPTENFITSFSRYYTPLVVGMALLISAVPPLLTGVSWTEWLNRGLIFLVISCPCALVVSIPLSFFGGIGAASKKGVLVKGGNYLEALNKLDIVVFDKTGTLTKGSFTVRDIKAANAYDAEEVLEMAAKAEAFSNHPIAHSILKAYGKKVKKENLSGYREIAGQGISVRENSSTLLAGNDKLMRAMDISFEESAAFGTKVYVAVNMSYAGCITISDEIKNDSRGLVKALKARGVKKTVMLTGDHPASAALMARELELDEAYGGLLPHEKVERLETLEAEKTPGRKLAYVGDGINDAPVLARADIGIAMGGLGSDAAIEAADIVLMTDEPSKLLKAMDAAKATKRIVRENIGFALGVKAAFLVMGALGFATMWEAVFADVGVALLAVLNASRIMRT